MNRSSLLFRNIALLFCTALAFASGWMLGFFQQGWQKKVQYFAEQKGVFTAPEYVYVASARVTDQAYVFAIAACILGLLLSALCGWAVFNRKRWLGWLLGLLWLGSGLGIALGYSLFRAIENVYWRRSPFLEQFYVAAVPLEIAGIELFFMGLAYAFSGAGRLSVVRV